MKKDIIERQKRISGLFDKLKETQGVSDQKKVMFQIYQELLDHNTQLWNENLDLRLKLHTLTQN